MAATHSSSLLKRAVALVVLAIPALAALGVVGPTSPARAATDGKGYWEVASDGGIFSFGDAKFQGSTGGTSLNAPIVGMAAHPSGDGYWFVASDGGVFGFGEAGFFGSMGGQVLNRPIVGIAAHPSGNGYWLVADDGGIFSFGAARFQGSMGGVPLNAPIVGMAAHPSGNGYWFVAADGGIFSFGDAKFFGSMGGSPLNAPIVGMAAHPSGNGYWFVARDGGIFSFGDAKFFGSMGGERLNQPIVGMATHPSGNGYWFVARDGGIFSFGESKFFGSMGGSPLNAPIVGMAATPDSTTPTATVNQAAGQADPTNDSSVDFTVTFSEPVGGFTGSDVTIGGTAGATTATVTGGPTTYNVALSGMVHDGTVTVSIPAGAAVDSSGNANAVATSTDNSVAYDNTDPGVTATKATGQADPASTAPINFTVVFSEAVSGFTAADVAIGGDTPGDETATVTGSGTTYNVAVSGMTGNGDVTVTVPAGGAFDTAGNANTASTVPADGDNTVAYDGAAPSATVSAADGQEDPTDEGTIDFKVVFDEAVTGFGEAGDVTVGGTATGTKTATITGDGTTYNVAVTGVTGDSGTVTVTVPEGKAVDAAGNPNTASNEKSISIDRAGPAVTVAVADAQENPTDEPTIDFTVTFAEAVTGFSQDDVALSGDTGANNVTVTGSGTTYNVAVTGMTGDGTVTITVAPGAASDTAGNASTGTDDASVTYDNTDPTVTVNQAAGQEDPTNESAVDFTVVFSEDVSGFSATDVDLGDSTAPGTLVATVSGGPTTYDVAVSGMTGNGTIVASVPAGSATDSAGNSHGNSTSTDNEVTYDGAAPSAVVSAADGQENPTDEETIDFKVVFDEPVFGFETGDVVPGGTAAGAKTATITGTGTTYNVAVTGVTGDSGTVTIKVLTGKALDEAGNPNAESNEATIDVDRAGPAVTVAVADGQENPTDEPTIDFTVTFAEAVTGFSQDDVALSGDTGANNVTVTGSGTTYNVAVTGMTGDGTVTITVAPGAASDTAGNASTGTDDASVTYDNTDPTPTLAKADTQENPTDESAIDFTVLFDEPVTDFDDAGDVDVTGAPGGTATIGDAGDGDAATYTVTVSGMTGNGGTVTVTIPEGAAADLAGNPSNASSSVSVTYDNLDPTFDSITANGGSTTVVATFSEPVLCSTVQTEEFAAAVGGTSEEVTAAVCDGTTDNTIQLTLANPPNGGESVAITYAANATPITDEAGNPVPSPTTRSTTAVSSFTVTVARAAGQDDPTNDEAVDYTVTFSQAVANDSFKAQDVVVGGDADYTADPVVTILDSGDSTTYNVAVSGFAANTTGNVTITVPAGGVEDGDGDLNAASTSDGDTDIAYDNVSPTVTVEPAEAQKSPTNDDTLDFTVVFSEVVTDFGTEDLDIDETGTADAEEPATVTITSTDGKTYNVAIDAPTGDGTVTLRVLAGGALDDAENGNQASAVTPASVTLDNTSPGVTIDEADGQSDPSNESAIDFEVTFTEPVFGLTAGDFVVTGTAGGTPTGLTATASPSVYLVTVTGMTQDGDVELALPANRATDEAGNGNTASTVAAVGDNVVTRETVRPAPTVTHADSDGLTNAEPIVFTVDFGEPVNGFTVDDLTITGNGAPTAVITPSPTGTQETYTVEVSDMTDGPVTLQVKDGGTTDDAGNTNEASNIDTVTYDTEGPGVTVSQHADQTEDPTNEAEIEFAVVFGETVTDFDASDVTVTGADPTATTVTGSGTTYRVVVSGMTEDEVAVTVSIDADRAHDTAGNGNEVSNQETIQYDTIAPTFTGIVSNAGSTKVFASFNEALLCTSVGTNDFTATVAGSPVVVMAVSCTAPHDDVIELTLSSPAPNAGETVEVTLRTGGSGVSDRAGNVTSTPTTHTTTAIPLTTTVTRVGPEYTNADTVDFTVEFSEDVTGFDSSDVTVTPAGAYTVSVAPATGPENIYTVTIADLPAGETTFSVSVGAGKAHDADGTPNTASNVATVTHDTVAPTFDSVDATVADDEVDAIFSEDLDCTSVAAEDFTVRFTTTLTAGAGTPASIATATCAGNVVTLTLSAVPPPGTTVEVTLTGDGVEDLGGNPSGTGTTVTDPA